MTLASGESPIFPLVVHQPAFPSIWPAVQSLLWCLSTNLGVTVWCICGCSCRVCDGCDLTSTLCKYDLRKGHLFVLSWMRWVRRGSNSSELLMCGGGVRSILLPRVSKSLETIDICIWRMFVLCLL